MADTDFGQGPKKVSPKPQGRSRGRGEGTARRCSKCHFELKVNEKHNSATFTTFPRLITSKPSNTCEAHKRCLCPCPYTCPLLRACHHLFLPYLTYIICWHSWPQNRQRRARYLLANQQILNEYLWHFPARLPQHMFPFSHGTHTHTQAHTQGQQETHTKGRIFITS